MELKGIPNPNSEFGQKLMEYAAKMALDYIPLLEIPPEHNESALKAYVAGFFAGHGAGTGESQAKRT